MPELYNKNEMITAVTRYLSDKGYELRPEYDPKLEPARVPVFASKNIGDKEDQEVFVDIITETKIKASDYFRDREISGLIIKNASSAKFFRHYFPNAMVYWAIPDYLEKDHDFEEFVDNCNNENIGLYEVQKNETEGFSVREYTASPKSLLEERLALLIQAIEERSKLNTTQKSLVADYLRRYSHEDISYLAFYPEPKYLATDISIRDEKYNISRELINRMSELKNLSYEEIIEKFSQSYNNKREDDYTIAHQVTQELWKRYNLQYPKLHQDFEQILKRDPKYRDHFLHAFQVFLYGAYIIDNNYGAIDKSGFTEKNGGKIEDAWLIAATYHDYNYMIQKFEDWTKDFFKDALHLIDDAEIAKLNFGESYIKNGYMHNTKILTNSLGLKVDDVTLKFLYNRIFVTKNHGLISALSLLKYLDKSKGNALTSNVANASCRAISIHDKGIWSYLSGLAENDAEEESMKAFKDKKVLPKLFFNKDPISFLLILSDTIQEQGRERSGDSKAELESLYFKDSKIFTEISFDGARSGTSFDYKTNEFREVEKFLDGGKQFVIKITDKGSGHKFELTI